MVLKNCAMGSFSTVCKGRKIACYGLVPDYYRLKIHESGGIYLDTNVELIRNLDDLRYNGGYCRLQFPGEVAFGLGFGAAKGNPVIKMLMKRHEQMHFINADGSMKKWHRQSIRPRI